MTDHTEPDVLPQGSLDLLQSPTAQRLLASAARRYLGPEEATAYLAQIDQPITRMARIAVRPSWVGVVDFKKRLPSALGGVSG